MWTVNISWDFIFERIKTFKCVVENENQITFVVRNYAYNMSCYVKVNGQFKVKDLRPISHTIAEDTLSIFYTSAVTMILRHIYYTWTTLVLRQHSTLLIFC